MKDAACNCECHEPESNMMHCFPCCPIQQEGPRFDEYGNRVNPDGSLWNLDGKLAARNGNE